MRSILITAGMLLLCTSMFGQTPSAPTPVAATEAAAETKMPEGIENTLRKYVSAYEKRSIADLLAVWPDLQNDKKEYKKIKKQFEDGNVSNEHISLQPVQTQSLNADAVVQCQRSERFVKRESVDGGGDNMLNRAPSQNAGPHEIVKDVKNNGKVWMKLHKSGDDWLIVSISEKPLSF